MGTSVRPQPAAPSAGPGRDEYLRTIMAQPEDSLAPDDLWERKVAEGMPKEQATAYVSAKHGAPGAPKDNSAGFLAQAAQGATLGFSDEIGGAVAGAIEKAKGGEFGKGFDRFRAAEKAARESYKADQPAGAAGAELAGAVATPVNALLPGVKAAGNVGAGGLTRTMAALRAGAAGGALAGAGGSEGGLVDRAKGAAVGGVAGGVIGGAAGAAIPLVAGGASKAVDLVPGLRPATRQAIEALPAPRLARGVAAFANPIPEAAADAVAVGKTGLKNARATFLQPADEQADEPSCATWRATKCRPVASRPP
jgi:hypothetical protein